jgi:hypothetical protein
MRVTPEVLVRSEATYDTRALGQCADMRIEHALH